ncbi:MAG: hypothetical protein R3C03_23970 [Pirellulaceae bacterium]
MKIILKRPAALGNGDRPAGFVLGETDAEALRDATEDNTKLPVGVIWDEVRVAIANPHLLDPAMPMVASSVPDEEEPETFWRDIELDSIEGLDSDALKPLTDAKITTLGAFADFQESGKALDPKLPEDVEFKLLEAIDKAVSGAN